MMFCCCSIFVSISDLVPFDFVDLDAIGSSKLPEAFEWGLGTATAWCFAARSCLGHARWGQFGAIKHALGKLCPHLNPFPHRSSHLKPFDIHFWFISFTFVHYSYFGTLAIPCPVGEDHRVTEDDQGSAQRVLMQAAGRGQVLGLLQACSQAWGCPIHQWHARGIRDNKM